MQYSLKTELLSMLVLVASWILGYYFYIHFPETVITHWNFAGQPDGYSGRAFGALFFPALLTGMYVLFIVLPFLDPKRERYESFAKVYAIIRSLILTVMALVFVASGVYNLGYPIRINLVIPITIGIMFLILGNYMGKVKQNWFVGVRLPWTLSSENVWNKTNRFGGYAMMVFGIIMIITPFLPQTIGMVAFALGILGITVGTGIYSYLVYRKEQQSVTK